MKRFFFLIALTMTMMLGYAQDIITLKDGTSIKGSVQKVTNSLVEYLDQDSTKCVTSKSQVFSISYADGKVETFTVVEQANSFSPYPESAVTRKLRRYKIWSKITCIYGIVNVASGLLLIATANSIDEDDYDDDFDVDVAKSFYKVVGGIGIAEGAASLIVSGCLRNKRERLMRETNIYGSAPIFSKEFKVNDNLSLTPSVNLMSYRNNPADGLGAGLSIRF